MDATASTTTTTPVRGSSPFQAFGAAQAAAGHDVQVPSSDHNTPEPARHDLFGGTPGEFDSGIGQPMLNRMKAVDEQNATILQQLEK